MVDMGERTYIDLRKWCGGWCGVRDGWGNAFLRGRLVDVDHHENFSLASKTSRIDEYEFVYPLPVSGTETPL